MRIFENFRYKLVALLVAIVLWAAAQGVSDEERSIDLPIVLEDVPEQLVVVDQSAHEINVRIQGSRAAVRTAQQDLERFAVSLVGIGSGETRLPLNADDLELGRGAKALASAPSTLVVKAESIESKQLAVRPDVGGSLPEGYARLGVAVEPPRIELSGARTALERIQEVQTEPIDISEFRETTTLPARLLLGVANVWRSDGGEGPVEVTVEIEAPASPESAEQTRESSATS